MTSCLERSTYSFAYSAYEAFKQIDQVLTVETKPFEHNFLVIHSTPINHHLTLQSVYTSLLERLDMVNEPPTFKTQIEETPEESTEQVAEEPKEPVQIVASELTKTLVSQKLVSSLIAETDPDFIHFNRMTTSKSQELLNESEMISERLLETLASWEARLKVSQRHSSDTDDSDHRDKPDEPNKYLSTDVEDRLEDAVKRSEKVSIRLDKATEQATETLDRKREENKRELEKRKELKRYLRNKMKNASNPNLVARKEDGKISKSRDRMNSLSSMNLNDITSSTDNLVFSRDMIDMREDEETRKKITAEDIPIPVRSILTEILSHLLMK